jgi:hypothetical protein
VLTQFTLIELAFGWKRRALFSSHEKPKKFTGRLLYPPPKLENVNCATNSVLNYFDLIVWQTLTFRYK